MSQPKQNDMIHGAGLFGARVAGFDMALIQLQEAIDRIAQAVGLRHFRNGRWGIHMPLR